MFDKVKDIFFKKVDKKNLPEAIKNKKKNKIKSPSSPKPVTLKIDGKNEQDIRLSMLNTFLMTPHGNLDIVRALHQEMVNKDIIFYAHLAAWYFNKGEVRDHREAFTAHLLTSKDPEYREVGCAFLENFPPYQVARVMDYCKISLKKFPKKARTLVVEYLHKREKDHKWFDSSVMRSRKAMKHLYASLRIKPDERAQKILFDNNPPEDSSLYFLKLLAKEKDPVKQAELIFEHKIPYPVAVGVIKNFTPSIMVSLVNSMSSQELINNMASLKQRGAFKDNDVKAIIEEKLEEAKKDSKVSTMKARVAAKEAGLSKEFTDHLEQVALEKAKEKGTLKKPTAILVDKSSSLHIAIEVGKAVATMCSSIAESELYVYAFDSMAFQIKSKGKDMAAWENAFKNIQASGCTSVGVPVEVMRKRKERVELFIIITDEEENTQPFFAEAYKKYCEDLFIYPSIVIVKVGSGTNVIEKQLNASGFEYSTYRFNGDYYSLPNLIPLLNQPGRLDLLMEIMDTPLPVRKK